MGKPQSGHFVASDEDFPEFKLLPQSGESEFVGFLTIYYLSPRASYPTHHHHPTYYVWGLN